jgi:glyceraldehyde 3-phosphate dehydrogenase
VADKSTQHLQSWINREALAESMIPMIGKLYRENNVVTSVYGRPVINRSVIDIIKAHRFVRQLQGNQLDVSETFPVLKALTELNLGPSRIDIGKLADKYKAEGSKGDVAEFVRAEVADALDPSAANLAAPKDIVLYGFGRIGRLVARILIEKAGGGAALRLRAIVVRNGGAANDLVKRASLLRRDSVHGSFRGTISVDEENQAIIANGNYIQVIYSNDPEEVDYTQYGIDNAIVVDNTGKWRDEAGLGKHLKCKGVSQAVLTAPGKGEIKNIVMGVNDDLVTSDDRILSAASCTTNAIVPVLKVVNDLYGIENGHVETVHSYTNDQNLIDNYHKADRRGRSAALNMVLTETGAAKAVAKAVPELEGKLTGNAVRVPVANVSIAILNLTLLTSSSKEEINEYLRDVALHSPLQNQIGYTESPDAVSSDFIGSREACTVDANATIVNGKNMILYLWYDNEFGYSAQVVRMVNMMAGVKYLSYPEDESMAY